MVLPVSMFLSESANIHTNKARSRMTITVLMRICTLLTHHKIMTSKVVK